MSETILQWIMLLKLIYLSGFAGLYGFGGIEGKWKRRIVGSLYLTLGVIGFSLWMESFNWWFISYALLLYGALSIGYGAKKIIKKIKKRTIAGLAYGCAAIPIAIGSSSLVLLCLHIALCILVSIVLGVFNPTKSARAEETSIGFIIGFLPLMGMI